MKLPYSNRPPQSNLFPTVEILINGVPIDVSSYFQELTFTEHTVGSGEGQLQLFDRDWDVLEAFLYDAGANAPVDFRFGFEGRVPDFWFRLLVGIYTPTFRTNQGTILDIELFDSGALLNASVSEDKGYPLDQYPRISDIVAEIAERNGWVPVIEKTKPHTRPFTQDGIPDTQFMLHELLEKARNEQGAGGYHCFIYRNKELHFHTATYQNRQEANVYAVYNVGRDWDGEVLEFSPDDQQVAAAAMGGRDTNFEIMDPKKRRFTVVRKRAGQSEQAIVGGGKVDPFRYFGNRNKNNVINRWITRPFENPDELETYASHRTAKFQQGQFGATLNIMGDPYIRPLQFVTVNVIKSDGQPHARWSGNFFINEITHNITAGRFTTSLDLTRESMGLGELNVSGKPLRIVNTEELQRAYARGDLIKAIQEQADG